MFYPLFLLVSLILSLVSAGALTALDAQQNTSDLIASNATFYAAESVLEENLRQLKRQKEAEEGKGNSLLHAFQLEDLKKSGASGDQDFASYAVNIVDRQMDEQPDYLLSKNQEKAFDEYRFFNVDDDYLFNRLIFSYERITPEQAWGGLILDLIVFPRSEEEDQMLNFGSLRKLATRDGDFSRNIKRMMIRTDTDNTSANEKYGFDKYSKYCNPDSLPGYYCSLDMNIIQDGKIAIEGLDPENYNYLVRFQTTNKEKISYSMLAESNGQEIDLPTTNQILEVDTETSTLNIFQRVKHQQRSFAPLHPGLDFVLFSDNQISR